MTFYYMLIKNWVENYLDYNRLNKAGVELWLARYSNFDEGFEHPSNGSKIKFPASMVKIWQYSETGSVPGISGNVDLDISYKAY